MATPRICLLLESFHPIVGGGERQGRILAGGLAARAVPTTVVTLRTRPDLPRRESFEGYEILRVRAAGDRWRAVAPVLNVLDRMRHRYDLIYVAGFRALGVPAVVVGRARRKRVVLRADNNGEMSGEFFDPGLRRWHLSHRSPPIAPLNAARKAVLRSADHFVAVADSIRREFLHEAVPEDKVSVIPYAVDLSRFAPADDAARAAARRALGLPADGPIVCFTGRLVSWKGPLTLLAAWTGVVAAERAAGRTEPLLLFLGSGGYDQHNCESEARAVAAAADLGSTVRFLGDVVDVETYLRASDVFALPTEDDLFAIALVEAMAAGLPPVTTRIAGLADYVVPEHNALVVEPRDATAVRAGLLRLLRDAPLRRRLGTAAVTTAQRFADARCLDSHLALFQRLA